MPSDSFISSHENPDLKSQGLEKHGLETMKPRERGFGETGAGNETRTRDLNLGKVALYQLSYSRGGV